MAHLATADTLTSSPIRSTIIGGRYSLDHLVAEGGMALIYRGRHIELDQTVAIKLVLPELAFDTEATARFLNEARTIAKLRSPHVARVLDSGCAEPGRPFMVLEYLEGGDLRKLLDVNSTVAVDTAVGLVLEAAEALAEAHAHGIIHRDIKPENLFLARMADGTVTLKVIDFGICKHRSGDNSRSFTLRGRTLGSPHYMAPEQITSPDEVDARADIWALGVVLYELLSGYQPFAGETLTSLCAHVVHSPPRKALRKVNPDVPVALERVVLRCLSKQPSERYASVVELAGALSPFCRRGRELCERIRRMAGQDSLARSVTPLALDLEEARVFRPRRRWLGPVVSALAVAAGLTLVAAKNPGAVHSLQTSVLATVNDAARLAASVAAVPEVEAQVETRAGGSAEESPTAAAFPAEITVAALSPAEAERRSNEADAPMFAVPEPAAMTSSVAAETAAPAAKAQVAERAAVAPAPKVNAQRRAQAFRAAARVRPRAVIEETNEPDRETNVGADEFPPSRPAAPEQGLLEPATVPPVDTSELIVPYEGGA